MPWSEARTNIRWASPRDRDGMRTVCFRNKLNLSWRHTAIYRDRRIFHVALGGQNTPRQSDHVREGLQFNVVAVD